MSWDSTFSTSILACFSLVILMSITIQCSQLVEVAQADDFAVGALCLDAPVVFDNYNCEETRNRNTYNEPSSSDSSFISSTDDLPSFGPP
ncbi:hypothetical protein HDV63DRAFT_415482 [Trichoderma sp. SZMC 28014]